METVNPPRGRELLIAARHIAVALGYDAADVTELAVTMGNDGRRDWPTADLLLTALAELALRVPGDREIAGPARETLGVPRPRVHRLAGLPDDPRQ
ncbi:hypothetical protein DQ384_33150 [Sphaerisporangium album]|uniref:Uncharacterized protein n=1 Tax=Sphaerisporangium album TaxID=509200 RepID=A0A367F4P7_9ACTN|nr:hypothetical protein [Sphaerisporangium album]RCG24490.1 hypothetical protein DQ384_33150 [Sphaerisporangium album]